MSSEQMVGRVRPRTESVVASKFAARAILVLDESENASTALVRKAADECRIELETVASVKDLERELSERRADLVLLSAESPRGEELCELVRETSGVRTAILGLCPTVSELTYGDFLCWGGDDLVSESSEEGIRARLRAVRDDLVHADAQTARPVEGMNFVVYGPNGADAGPVARQLRSAGHQVASLSSVPEVEKHLESGESVRLVLDARSPGAVGLVKLALTTASCINIVITCAPQLIGELRRQYASNLKVTVIDSYAPPDAVLLVVNDMKRGGHDRRVAERALYSSLVAFRAAGDSLDELGFVHNISEGGIYLRTLVKPESDLVWIELTPPGSSSRVRLEGRVAWRTRLARHRESGVPTGFGVQIQDGSRLSLEQWKTGYERLIQVHEHGRPQQSAEQAPVLLSGRPPTQSAAG